MAQRLDGKTPFGGDYTEITFFDKEGKEVEKQFATKLVVKEFTNEGKLVHETIMTKKEK